MSISELEILRKKARNIVLWGIFCSCILSIILFFAIKNLILCGFLIMIGILISFLISSKPSKKFFLAFKETFVLKSLKNVFTNLIYEPEKGIPEYVIANTRMMYMGDRYSSNDYVCGKYKNINIEQADVHIEKEEQTTDSDGNTKTTWVTIFRGRWMIFDFNKMFKSNIQVSQKGFSNSRINNFNEIFKYKKVMMEDQEFNKKFKIYAQSEHEAFYILTPTLIEKIKKMADSIKGSIILCFVDNKLHVGVYNNKDSFEHGIFTKIKEEKVMSEISKDIKLITNFVDELNLDNDLFRKEV